jgi:MoaA/NifB/PqqE/SkfB family radical SAM enzyme
VYYFNIDYHCNNNCIYCFSSSTGATRREISLEVFEKIIEDARPSCDDKIIINGGEPSLHKNFYQIIKFLTESYESEIVVYTNGRNLTPEKLSLSKKIKLVIPMHGNEPEHNYITQNRNAFKETLNSLKNLQSLNVNYIVKFILNYEMLKNFFDPIKFLNENELSPSEIMIARLNETKKSKSNKVPIVGVSMLRDFLSLHTEDLNKHFKVKYLDIPFCYFDSSFNVKEISNTAPIFYFSDDKNYLIKRDYFKDVKIGYNCQSCKHSKLCDMMKKTYLTLCWNKHWCLEAE